MTRMAGKVLPEPTSLCDPGVVRFPMTAAQARFWRHEQLSESAGANNSLATMRLTGRLEVGKFASALRSLITRHEILRTRIRAKRRYRGTDRGAVW